MSFAQNLRRNTVSFINCGFFPSGAGLNYLAMEANPSQCSVDKRTGAVECACKRADLAGPGYCQRQCDVVELTAGPPINSLVASNLHVGVSWPKVAAMLTNIRQNLEARLEANRELDRKDGTQVIAKMAGNQGADEEDTGVGHPTIVALVCVAAFAVVAVAVISIQRVREQSRDPAASFVDSGSTIGDTTDASSAYASSKSASTFVPFAAKTVASSHGSDLVDGTLSVSFDQSSCQGSYQLASGGTTIASSETSGDRTDDTVTETTWTKQVSEI